MELCRHSSIRKLCSFKTRKENPTTLWSIVSTLSTHYHLHLRQTLFLTMIGLFYSYFHLFLQINFGTEFFVSKCWHKTFCFNVYFTIISFYYPYLTVDSTGDLVTASIFKIRDYLSSAVIWMVSIFIWISSSASFSSTLFGILQRVPLLVVNTVIFLLHFFTSLKKCRYFSSCSLPFILITWFAISWRFRFFESITSESGLLA